MDDYGTRARESVERQIELRLKHTYTEAQKDILRKLSEFTSKYKAKDKAMRKKLDKGLISQEKYDRWLAGQVFMGAQWEEKVKDITDMLVEIRQDDLKMIRDRQIDVFTTNANYQAYCLEHDIGKNFGFDLYDEDAVKNLLENKPALLPEKIVNRKKHNHWNQGIISNCVTQGIIQGESIPKIAARIAHDTAYHNDKASTLYARTAMTSAQNAGRMQMLRDSKAKGINVKKRWMATHDARTRDSHIRLDGQIAEVEKPFKSELGKIDYPGDPHAKPGDVYNCRCTLVYVYPEYEDLSEFENDNEVRDEKYEQWLKRKEKLKEKDRIKENQRFTSEEKNNKIISGGVTGAKKTKGWGERHAAKYYEEVRKRKPYSDAKRISKYVSMSEDDIEKVRNHVFVDEHDLNGEIKRFDPDKDQADAWQRLGDGKGTEEDIVFLHHELAEANYMAEGYSQAEAHALANQQYNWWSLVEKRKGIK